MLGISPILSISFQLNQFCRVLFPIFSVSRVSFDHDWTLLLLPLLRFLLSLWPIPNHPLRSLLNLQKIYLIPSLSAVFYFLPLSPFLLLFILIVCLCSSTSLKTTSSSFCPYPSITSVTTDFLSTIFLNAARWDRFFVITYNPLLRQHRLFSNVYKNKQAVSFSPSYSCIWILSSSIIYPDNLTPPLPNTGSTTLCPQCAQPGHDDRSNCLALSHMCQLWWLS